MAQSADFYLLERPGPQAVLHFVCRFVRKLQQQNKGALIWADSAAQAHSLDDLLWTFSDESFIPHSVIRDSVPSTHDSVQICNELPHSSGFKIVLSLNQQTDVTLPTNPRIAEIISGDDKAKQMGRARYARYRDMGIDLKVHPIAA